MQESTLLLKETELRLLASPVLPGSIQIIRELLPASRVSLESIPFKWAQMYPMHAYCVAMASILFNLQPILRLLASHVLLASFPVIQGQIHRTRALIAPQESIPANLGQTHPKPALPVFQANTLAPSQQAMWPPAKVVRLENFCQLQAGAKSQTVSHANRVLFLRK